MTPFGSPVLPLEKMTVARSSSSTFSARTQGPLQPAHGQQPGHEKRRQFFRRARTRRAFLDENQLARHRQLDLFQKRFRGDDGFDVALPDAGGEGLLRQRVVQVHRHFAEQHRREIHQRARHRGRQEQPDLFLPGPSRFQSPRQKNRFHQRRAKTHFGRLRIGHGKAERMPPRRAHERPRAAAASARGGKLHAEASNSCTAWRTSEAFARGGIGAPKLTVTG